MRICIATAEYPPATGYLGGVGTQMETLADALTARDHQVEVLTVATGDEGFSPASAPFRSVARPQLGRFFFIADSILAARISGELKAAEPVDLVLAPEYGGLASRYARSSRRSAPLLTMLQTSLVQAMTMETELEWRGLQLHRKLQARREHMQTRSSDALLSCSTPLLEWSRQEWDLGELPSAVLPNMIDVRKLRALAGGEPPSVPGEGPLVVFSGRLERRKGVDVLLHAMQAVWRRESEARLVLAGAPGIWSARSIAPLIATEPRVTAMGSLTPEALMPLLRAADIVVTPSRWEAFGLATYEAMALGTAVIATRSGGFAEFLEHGEHALLAAPGDPRELADAILELLGDRRRRERLGAGGASHAERFDVGVLAPRYEKYFEGVAGR